jgi:hypothetical protein
MPYSELTPWDSARRILQKSPYYSKQTLFSTKMKSLFVIATLLIFTACSTVDESAALKLEDTEIELAYSGDYIEAENITQVVRRTRVVIPVIPMEFRGKDVTGTVRATIIIDPEGVPVHILRGEANHSRFLQAFIDVYERWRFTPVEQGGKKVYAAVETGANFNCKDQQVTFVN